MYKPQKFPLIGQDIIESFKKKFSYKINIEGKEENAIVDLIPMIKSTFCKVNVPKIIINELNEYLDFLYNDPNSKSKADSLAGEIKMGEMNKGKQLKIDVNHKLLIKYKKFLEFISKEYIKNHFNSKYKNYDVLLDELWSVHQYETDYNPIHTHNNRISEFGISTFLHLKMPDFLIEKNRVNNKNNIGYHDGRTYLTWDYNHSSNIKNLKYPNGYSTTGEIGKLYIFPQWLEHTVYPFFGEGERRTIAGNLALIFK